MGKCLPVNKILSISNRMTDPLRRRLSNFVLRFSSVTHRKCPNEEDAERQTDTFRPLLDIKARGNASHTIASYMPKKRACRQNTRQTHTSPGILNMNYDYIKPESKNVKCHSERKRMVTNIQRIEMNLRTIIFFFSLLTDITIQCSLFRYWWTDGVVCMCGHQNTCIVLTAEWES